MKKRSQISVEFLIIFISLLFIFTLVLSMTSTRNSIFFAAKKNLHAREMGDMVAFAINEVYLVGPNATKTIYLPPTLRDGTEYTLTFYPNIHLLYVDYSGGSYSTSLATNITGSFGYGRDNLIIYNEKGVYVE